jgi:hypothetical protein
VIAEFNCNSFTNDCIGFLTGGSIPSHISGMSPSNLIQVASSDTLQICPRIFSRHRWELLCDLRSMPCPDVPQLAQHLLHRRFPKVHKPPLLLTHSSLLPSSSPWLHKHRPALLRLLDLQFIIPSQARSMSQRTLPVSMPFSKATKLLLGSSQVRHAPLVE